GNNMPSTTFSGGTPAAGGYRMGNPSPDSGLPRSGSGISGVSGGISGGSGGISGGVSPGSGDGRSSMGYPPPVEPYPMTRSETSSRPLNDLSTPPTNRNVLTDPLAGSGRMPPPPAMIVPMGDHAAQTNDMYQKTSTAI